MNEWVALLLLQFPTTTPTKATTYIYCLLMCIIAYCAINSLLDGDRLLLRSSSVLLLLLHPNIQMVMLWKRQ